MVYCTDTSGKQRQLARLSLNGQMFRQYLGVSALAEWMLVDATGRDAFLASRTASGSALSTVIQ